MAVRQSYLSVEDFDSLLTDYAGRNITHTPRTKAKSFSGKEEFSDGTPASIFCYFLKRHQQWTFDKSAQIEGGDAVLLSKAASGVDKNDKVTADGVVYYIKDIIHVPGVFNDDGTVTMVYSYCNCFLYS